MPTVIVKPAIHVRLKRLALDAGKKLGEFLHDHLEESLSRAERSVAGFNKKKTK
jgi:hypothetical protein